jgi:predicted phage tail protein
VASVTGTPANARITLAWSAPDDGGLPITHYSVESSTDDGGTWSAPVSTGSASTGYTVVGLTNARAYRFRVSATNSAGESDWSAATSALTPYTIPGSPTRLRGVAGARSVRLSWTAPSSNGSAITGYAISYRIYPSTVLRTVTRSTGSAATSATVPKLTAGLTYVFVVRAVNAAGAGPQSGRSNKTVPFTTPTRVTNVRATAGTRLLDVRWSPPRNGGSPLLGYRFLLSTDGGRTWLPYARTAKATATSMRLSGLRSAVRYSVKVLAFNAGGAGTPSMPTKALLVR